MQDKYEIIIINNVTLYIQALLTDIISHVS